MIDVYILLNNQYGRVSRLTHFVGITQAGTVLKWLYLIPISPGGRANHFWVRGVAEIANVNVLALSQSALHLFKILTDVLSTFSLVCSVIQAD